MAARKTLTTKILLFCLIGASILGILAFFGFLEFSPEGNILNSAIVGFIGILTILGFLKIIKLEILSFNQTP